MSRLGRLRSWLVAHPIVTVVLGGVFSGAVVAVATGRLELPRVGQEWGILLLFAFVMAAPGAIAGKWVVDLLWSEDYHYLIDIDPGNERGGYKEWRLGPDSWDDLQVLDGELYRPRNSIVPVAFCEEFDSDELVCNGTWRGSRSDLELIQDRELIKDVRGELEQQARWGLTVRIRSSSLVRKAVKRVTLAVVAQIEGLTMFDGDALEDAIDDATKDLDVQDLERDIGEDRPTAGPADTGNEGAPLHENLAGGADSADVAADGGSTDG